MRLQKISYTLLILLVVTALSSSVAYAHCIWSEPPSQITLDEDFIVKAFYAHPDDPIEGRDMTDLSLYVLDSDGQKVELELKKLATYQQAVANLSQPDLYVFILEREPNRYRLQEIRDYGLSFTVAGDHERELPTPVGIPLEVHPMVMEAREGGLMDLSLQVLYNGEPVAGAEIEVFESLEPAGEVHDEIDEVEVDDDGMAKVIIDPAFNYVFETDHRVPAGEVDDTGIFITEVRFRSTLFLGAW